ncbi:MAG: rhomboid family intramembrane serine protease [Dysgonamonadaceae bacterium]|jgi:membrane associated rhomboid family serine protease|nr:rhomboid family intramembrane serine protease [Dysgonamonadaceae bacterium]
MNESRSAFSGIIPTVTKNLIIINGIVWLAQVVLLRSGIDLVKLLGLHYVESPGFRIYQVVTSLFLHDPGNFLHVLSNMFAVFMFGRTLEQVWGPKRYLSYYFITGIGAAVVDMLVVFVRVQFLKNGMDTASITEVYAHGYDAVQQGMNYTNPAMGALNSLINSPSIGASGAVFGILLAFAMLFPNVELFIIPFPFPIKAKWLIIGYGVYELFLGIRNLPGDYVAHFAHLGGILFGFFLILYWKKKGRRNYGGYY